MCHVGVQIQDQGYLLDRLSVLRTLPGTYAERLAVAAKAVLDPPAGPIAGRAPAEGELAEFVAACERRLLDTKAALSRELRWATLVDCLSLAVLLGQNDQALNDLVTASPNAFTYEMEFLSTLPCTVEKGGWITRRRKRAAFSALRWARRHRILSELLDNARRIIGQEHTLDALRAHRRLRDMLVPEWMSIPASFNTRYDWAYSRRLAKRLTQLGAHHPDLDSLQVAVENWMLRWSGNIYRFQKEIAGLSPTLHKVARTHQLLSEPEIRISRAASRFVEKYSRRLVLTQAELSARLAEERQTDIAEWINLLTCVPNRFGRNARADPLFEPTLSTAPLLMTSYGVFPVFLHVPSTNLSRVLERVFASRPSVQYYRARGEELEQSALAMLSNVFTEGRVVHGGMYRGDRKGELIEVDGLLLWRDIALVIESKGGFISGRSRRGDDASALGEFRKTVGDGFFQASRLLRTLERDGQVELATDKGDHMVLDRREIRRAYVVIPTADTFGGITTSPELLWDQGVLAKGSLPLIIAVQDLNLMTDVLPTPTEFIAYMDYREEVLSRPSIYVADEEEILGSFVGGLDIIGEVTEQQDNYSFQRSQSSWKERRAIATIGTDAQEAYLNPWIFASYVAERTKQSQPDPPRRHSHTARMMIENMLKSRRDLAAASIAMRFPDGTLDGETEAPRSPSRGRPVLLTTADLGLVIHARGERIAALKQLAEVDSLRSQTRYVAYVCPTENRLVLRHAEMGRKHSFFGDGNRTLAQRSRLGDQIPWFEDFAKIRKKGTPSLTAADEEDLSALVRAGMDESAALGVVRLGLGERVLALASDEVSLNQAADMYLTHVRTAADLADVAVADISLSHEIVRDVMRLLNEGRIDKQKTVFLLELLLEQPDSTPEEVARTANLLSIDEEQAITEAVQRALEKLGLTATELTAMNKKQREKTHKRLMGEIRNTTPSVSLKTVDLLIRSL